MIDRKLLDLISNEDTDWKEVVLKVAEIHPDSLLEAIQEKRAQVCISEEIKQSIKSGKVVNAIKMYMTQNGTSLKEAKQVIDDLRAEMGVSY